MFRSNPAAVFSAWACQQKLVAAWVTSKCELTKISKKIVTIDLI